MNGFVSTLSRLIKQLESNGFDYMIVGSVASTIYGEPRLTRDIDLVVSISLNALEKLNLAFPKEKYYLPPSEILTQEIQRQGQFNVIDQVESFKIDLVLCKKSPHALSEFSRKRRIEILPSIHAWVASPEDVIIKKLQFFIDGRSEKHLNDIRGIVANSKIDETYLISWIRTLFLEDAWKQV